MYLGVLESDPKSFKLAESVEKLSVHDSERFKQKNDVSQYHCDFVIPAGIDIRTLDSFDINQQPKLRKKRDTSEVLSFFGTEIIFVGVEYFVSPNMGFFGGGKAYGVSWSNLVSWSSTRSGIARKMATQYFTKKDTCEAWSIKEENFDNEYKQVVFIIEAEPQAIDFKKSSRDSYTWRKDEPLAQIRLLSSTIKKILHKESLLQEIKEYEFYQGTNTWEGERYISCSNSLNEIEACGNVIGTEVLQPPLKRLKQQESNIPCFACSK